MSDQGKKDYEAFQAVTMKTDEDGNKYVVNKGTVRLKGLHVLTDTGYTAPLSPSLIFKKIRAVTHYYGLDPIYPTLIPIDYFNIELKAEEFDLDDSVRFTVYAVTGDDKDKLFELTLSDITGVIAEFYHPKEIIMLMDAYDKNAERDN